MGINEKLLEIQTELKAPKSQYNSFGKYNYRNCEDILEALKPLLAKVKATVVISDEIINIAQRFYVKATAKIIDVESGEMVETTAYAREEESKKGMDGSQVTGASSSYARKYALNGLFSIDDNRDSDYAPDSNSKPASAPKNKPLSKETQEEINRRIMEYAKVSKMPVSEITAELSKVVKKELKEINEVEAKMIVSYLGGKINKAMEGAV